jgi:hypothetical protein
MEYIWYVGIYSLLCFANNSSDSRVYPLPFVQVKVAGCVKPAASMPQPRKQAMAHTVFLDYAKRKAVIIKPSSQLPLLDFFEARETLRIHLLKTVS